MNILDEISGYARERVESAKKKISAEEMKKMAYEKGRGDFAFEKKLSQGELSFICECKKASPSKGIIAEEFPYLDIAKEYENAGADCISVLTEPKWFLGDKRYLEEISEVTGIPCLRKDFIVDEYMIYEAKVLGASAVLLICALRSDETLCRYIRICDELGLSALVEAHNESEVKQALKAGARVLGINNRNLADFSVDTENAKNMRKYIPEDVIFVSESGIRDGEDVLRAKEAGADAVLVGESLMRAKDKKEKLMELKRLI